VGLLVSSSFANEIFIDLTLGHSLNFISYSYTLEDNVGNGYSNGFEEIEFNLGLRAGVSMDMYDSFGVEPSIGVTTSYLTNIYSLELPVLYSYENIKFGPLIRYNYLTNIGIKYLDNVVKIEDKTSYSLGVKAIIVTSKIDYIFSYEYMLNAVYDDESIQNNKTTTTQLNMEGSYFSFGLRVKF